MGVLLLASSSILTSVISAAVAISTSSSQSQPALACTVPVDAFVSGLGGWITFTSFLYLFLSIASIGAASAAKAHHTEASASLRLVKSTPGISAGDVVAGSRCKTAPVATPVVDAKPVESNSKETGYDYESKDADGYEMSTV